MVENLVRKGKLLYCIVVMLENAAIFKYTLKYLKEGGREKIKLFYKSKSISKLKL